MTLKVLSEYEYSLAESIRGSGYLTFTTMMLLWWWPSVDDFWEFCLATGVRWAIALPPEGEKFETGVNDNHYLIDCYIFDPFDIPFY